MMAVRRVAPASVVRPGRKESNSFFKFSSMGVSIVFEAQAQV
jgi:hypothetical protein